MKAVQIFEHGPAECMKVVEVELPSPMGNHVLVRHRAVGVNYKDIYERSGLYPLSLPSGLGFEAAGVVEEVGDEVSEFKPGDRVAFCYGTTGAYAEESLVPESILVPLPDGIAFETAAAILTKGLTAEYLINKTHQVAKGEWVVIYAAAGGVGSLLTQWALSKGARVIAIVGSQEKRDFMIGLGCELVINYSEEPIREKVLAWTDGQGARVVYDSVGAATWEDTLAITAIRGLIVSYGNASGAVEPFQPLVLAARSLYVTRPSLGAYVASREELLAASELLFREVEEGNLKVTISATFPLADAVSAHTFIESRKSIGSVILVP